MTFVTSLNYFIYRIRYIVEPFKTSFTELLPRWTVLNIIYGILHLIQRFKTWFTWFGAFLNHFRPRLRDSLSRLTISDLIYRIRYHVKLIQTSLTGFVTSFELFATSFTVFITSFNNFRPNLRVRHFNLTQVHETICYFIYTYFTPLVTWKLHLITHWGSSVTH